MSQFWPTSNKGSVLLTTQDSRWLAQEYVSHGIGLKSLGQEEGVDLVNRLFERKRRTISTNDAITIFEKTGGLPLAMRQIASYMVAESLEPVDFWKSYRDRRRSEVVNAWNESSTPWYSHTLATFLDVAFAKLTGRAISILIILSVLDGKKIQEKLLYQAELPDGSETNEVMFPEQLEYVSCFVMFLARLLWSYTNQCD